MSYLTLIPNFYCGNGNQMGQVANQYLINQNNANTKSILNYLKSALNISLCNYQLNHQNVTVAA